MMAATQKGKLIMAVRKRGRIWYYDFMIRGIRYREAIPEAHTKKQAEQAEAQAKLDVFQGKYGRPTGTHSLAQFAKEVYLPWARDNKRSWRSDVSRVEAIIQYYGKKSFREVSPILIEKFKRDRGLSETVRGSKRSPASVNRELETLSRIFNMAIHNGQAETNPCQKVNKLRRDNSRNRYLLPDEESRLMATLNEQGAYLRPIIVLALNTGMRRGEILGLKWSCVDFQRGIIYVGNTKTSRDREVPMNAAVRQELLELHGLSECEYVFVNPETGARRVDIKKRFATICRETEIGNFRFHDLRHTAATRMADAGIDAFTIAEILGHTTLQMTKRYTHPLGENKRLAVESLNGYAENNCLKFVTNDERQAI
jgi:integrase